MPGHASGTFEGRALALLVDLPGDGRPEQLESCGVTMMVCHPHLPEGLEDDPGVARADVHDLRPDHRAVEEHRRLLEQVGQRQQRDDPRCTRRQQRGARSTVDSMLPWVSITPLGCARGTRRVDDLGTGRCARAAARRRAASPSQQGTSRRPPRQSDRRARGWSGRRVRPPPGSGCVRAGAQGHVRGARPVRRCARSTVRRHPQVQRHQHDAAHGAPQKTAGRRGVGGLHVSSRSPGCEACCTKPPRGQSCPASQLRGRPGHVDTVVRSQAERRSIDG